MHQKTETEATLDHAVTSLLQGVSLLLRVKGSAYTVGVLESLLHSLLSSDGVTDAAMANLITLLAPLTPQLQRCDGCGDGRTELRDFPNRR